MPAGQTHYSIFPGGKSVSTMLAPMALAKVASRRDAEGMFGRCLMPDTKIHALEDAKPETAAGEIALFDFISHENMHLPFNEEYLRTLRAAYPADRIIFHAGAGHVANLAQRVQDMSGIVFKPCPRFDPPFGLSRHNPMGGRLAARACRAAMKGEIADRPLRLVTLLGVDANLYAVVGMKWPTVSRMPMHMILHGQLGDNMVWRSRNPAIRAYDLISEVKRPLPPSVRLIALELGVREAIAEIAPTNGSVVTFEHPVLVSEWGEDLPPTGDILNIGFLGNARRSKGFELFAHLARSAARPDLAFESVGIAAPDTAEVDMSGLSRRPTPTPLSRADYLAVTRNIDLVCLPLHGRAYDFTASGTLADAVAALKPLVAFRNRTLDAIVARYGPIGWLVESEAELFYLVQTLDRGVFMNARPEWVANLRAIREARRPETLAPRYRQLVDNTPRGV